MSIDLFRSRRGFNEYCKWWTRNESESIDPARLVMEQKPSGTFYAKEISAETYNDNVLGGMFRFDKTVTVIQSPDDLEGMHNNDVVLYQGEIWFVRNVQKRKFRIQSTEFATDRHCSHNWYIELRK